MATSEVVSQIDSNALIAYLAQGNPFIWMLLILGLFAAFVATWIYFEPKIRSLVFFLKDVFSKEEKEEKLKEKNAFLIKSNLLMSKIYAVITKTDALNLSKDIGRNHFYHYMVNTSFEAILRHLKKTFEEYQSGDIPEEIFCSYHKLHALKITAARKEFVELVTRKLKDEGWSDDMISYVLQIYIKWLSNHTRFLSELISSSTMPTEIIMSWWVFYYDVFLSLDEFGIMLNGRITGQVFEKLKIGKPDKRNLGNGGIEEKL